MQLKCNVLNELWKFGREAFRFSICRVVNIQCSLDKTGHPLTRLGITEWGTIQNGLFYDFTGRCEDP